MYAVLLVFALMALWAVSCLGQMTFTTESTQTQPRPFDRMKRRIELREKMHRRMMEKLTNGSPADPSLFEDMEKEMNEVLQEDFPSNRNPNFGMEWQQTKSGRILIITPQSKEQKLEIDTKPEIVTIKGKSEQKSAQGLSVSEFSNSFSVPEDCDGSRVKMSQQGGKIVMEFPYKSMQSVTVPKKNEVRKPLPPTGTEVEI